MRVLLIEDDPLMASSIEHALSSEGIVTEKAFLGVHGIDSSKVFDFDLIILDLMLPDIDGYEVLLRLRSSKVKIPVLILSDLTTPEQKIKGLGFGADDFLSKPFNKGELIARVHAIVRRSKGHSESLIKFDKVTLNLDSRIVEVHNGQHNKTVHLTNKEYAILELLAMRKGTVLTKDMFLSHLYSGMDEPEVKIIDVFICKLRKKLAEASGNDTNYIETIWGRGYILKTFSDDDEGDSVKSSSAPSA